MPAIESERDCNWAPWISDCVLRRWVPRAATRRSAVLLEAEAAPRLLRLPVSLLPAEAMPLTRKADVTYGAISVYVVDGCRDNSAGTSWA